MKTYYPTEEMRGSILLLFVIVFSMVVVKGYSISDNEDKVYSRITDVSFDIATNNGMIPTDVVSPDINLNHTFINFAVFGEILNNHTGPINMTYREGDLGVHLYVELNDKTVRYRDSNGPFFLPGDLLPPPDVPPIDINPPTLPPPYPPIVDDQWLYLEPGLNDFTGKFSLRFFYIDLKEIPHGNYTFKFYIKGVHTGNNANTTLVADTDGIHLRYDNLPAVWNDHTQQLRLDLGISYLFGSLLLMGTWQIRRTVKKR